MSLVVAMPGCFLLNQSLKIFPATTSVDGVVINDEPVETTTITTYLLGTAAVLFGVSTSLFFLAQSNRRKNHASLIDARDMSGEISVATEDAS